MTSERPTDVMRDRGHINDALADLPRQRRPKRSAHIVESYASSSPKITV